MTRRAEATAAVLDEMVAGIMGAKADKATRLTPVGTETARLPRTPAPFPNDHPQEVVEQQIVEIERVAQNLMDAAAALRLLANRPAQVSEPVDTKAKERAADARAAAEPSFAEKFAAMQAEAQASVFKDAGPAPVKSKWTCPEHGDVSIIDDTSPKGREYGRCGVTNCKEFERK